MYWILPILTHITLTVSFALNYTSPPQCDYTSSLNPQTNAYLAMNDKIFLCIFMTAGPRTMYSLAFQVAVDTYSSLQLTGAVHKLGVPTTSGEDGGFYIWAATPRKLVGPVDTNTTGLTLKTFANSKKGNRVAAWPKDCGDAVVQGDELPAAILEGVPEYSTDVLGSCPFMLATDTHVLPILSLVVNMEQGNITSLAWDNQCMTCASNSPECLKGYQGLRLDHPTLSTLDILPDSASGLSLTGGCAAGREVCVTSVADATANVCDPKVLVTFSGTDRNDRQLSTAGLRISQFAGLSVSSLWDSLVYSFVPTDATGANDTVINAADDHNP